jgi:hypothetical protein
MDSPIVFGPLRPEDYPFANNAHITLLTVEGFMDGNNKLAGLRKLLLHAANVVLKSLGELLAVVVSGCLGQVDLLEGLA